MALVVSRLSKFQVSRNGSLEVKQSRNKRVRTKALGGEELVTSSNVSWEVVAGAIAGVTPFVVAGIEFSKRIAAQRRCTVCGGSGLVKRDEYYFRCYRCGGFLPWQSWKRFFSG